MRQSIIVLAGILSLIFYGCNSYKTPDELKGIFYQNKSKLDSFINIVQKDKKLDSIFSHRTEEQGWTFSDIKQIYPGAYNLLINAGISEASGHRVYGAENWYFLKTNWPNEYPIYLTYKPWDSLQTLKGFYEKDEVSNETWGLGDRWLMFRWVKDKPYKQ
jgi:hypothetical protein